MHGPTLEIYHQIAKRSAAGAQLWRFGAVFGAATGRKRNVSWPPTASYAADCGSQLPHRSFHEQPRGRRESSHGLAAASRAGTGNRAMVWQTPAPATYPLGHFCAWRRRAECFSVLTRI